MKNKTISLPEDIYNKLKQQKKKDESFPELIDRLVKEKKSKKKQLEALAGSLREDDEWDQIIKDLYVEGDKDIKVKMQVTKLEQS